MNLNKYSKQELAQLIQQAEQKAATAEANTAKVLDIANYLNNNLIAIDNRILSTSFKGEPKAKLWFVLQNWKEIVALIEFIIGTIKEVKERIKTVTQPVEQPNGNA